MEFRYKVYRDWVKVLLTATLTPIPGACIFVIFAIWSALMFKSTLYTIMVVGTAFFLLGNVIGERKGQNEVDQS